MCISIALLLTDDAHRGEATWNRKYIWYINLEASVSNTTVKASVKENPAMALHNIISKLSLLVLLIACLTAAMPIICKNDVLRERLNTTIRFTQEYLESNENVSDFTIATDCTGITEFYCDIISFHLFAQNLNESNVSQIQ